MAKYRKGDVVTIEGVVESAYDGMKIKIGLPDYQTIYFERDQVKMKRALIEVGDTIEKAGHRYEVKAIDGEDLWLRSLVSGAMHTMDIDLVTRVDLDAEPMAEVAATDPLEPPPAPAGEA